MRRSLSLGLALVSLAAFAPSLPAATFLHKRLTDWRADLESAKQPAARRAAAFALGRLGGLAVSAADALARGVSGDSDDGVREMAACALGDIALAMKDVKPTGLWQTAGPPLQAALAKDTSPRVRRAAAYALGAFGEIGADALPGLRSALRDDSATVRQNAAWAIGRLDATGATVDDLCERLDDAAPLVRRDAAAAIGQLAARLDRGKLRPAEQPLLKLVRDEADQVVRKTALGTMASLADESHRSAAGDIYPLLNHPDAEMARAAAFTLGNMGGVPAKRALPVLRAALADPDPGIQSLAAASLGNAREVAADAVEDLGKVFREAKQVELKRNCAIAIGRITKEVFTLGLDQSNRDGERTNAWLRKMDAIGKAVLPGLMETLTAPRSGESAEQDELRYYVAEAVGSIPYPYSVSAYPALKGVLKSDPNHAVRQRCLYALRFCKEPERYGLLTVMTGILDETGDEAAFVRYDVARILAHFLHERAPDKVIDVLLDMITNRKLRQHFGTRATVEGVPAEGKGGSSRARSVGGGDARFMAADAMGALGSKGRSNKRVIAALKKAATDSDETLKKSARDALRRLEARD